MKTQWQPKRAYEKRYARAIERLFKSLWSYIRTLKNPFSIRQAIARYARSPAFTKAAEDIARAMATNTWLGVARNWRIAAMKSSRGRVIYQALKNELETASVFHTIVKNNARYIKTMPLTVAEKVTKDMAKGYAEGKRPEELLEQVLQEAPHLTHAHARLIARTETSKASTALTRMRAEEAGLGWYVWRSSDDERVRSSHSHMEGVIIPWGEPPSPEALDPAHEQKPYGNYHAGETFNCRCYPQPLIDYADVAWPARVYYKGKIQRMTLAKFKGLTGGEL